jgi:hypothetical protein
MTVAIAALTWATTVAVDWARSRSMTVNRFYTMVFA